MKLREIFLSILLVYSLQITAQESENNYSSLIYKTFSDDGTWCWFSDPRAIHFNGKIYSGWVSADGSIMAGCYDEKNGKVKEVNIYPKFNKDDHANPSFLLLPDKRIMLFFSSHNGKGNGEKEPAILYTISKHPEDISEWEPLQRKTENVEGKKGFCYTNPVMLSEENNRIYIFWRGADWKPTFSYTDDFGLTWSKSTPLIKSSLFEDKRPYVKVSSNGRDEIHFAFTDGHPINEPFNSIYYFKYKAGKFYKADGTLLGSLDNLPLEHEDCDMVYDANKDFLKNRFGIRSWIWDVATDKNGNPVLAYVKLRTESEHSYWYAKWDGQEWLNSKISDAGSWFPRYKKTKSQREPEPYYSGGVTIDHENTDVVFYSIPVGDVFEIFAAETQNSGADWKVFPVTLNSKKDNVRPFAIRGANENAKVQVLWMFNNKYSYYKDYQTEIKMSITSK